MLIREFNSTDAEAVSELIAHTLRTINAKTYPSEIIENVVVNHSPTALREKAKHRTIFVAEEDGRILGTVSVERETSEKSVIYSIFVVPDLHGKKIGTQLITRAEECVRENGSAVIQIPAAVDSVGFYEKLGYRLVKKVTHELYGENLIVEKVL